MSKYKSTKYPGVRYREHKTRKHGILPDQYFFIRYQKDGKRKEEGVGWASEGWTPSKVALKLAELKAAAATGEGESRLSEARAKIETEKQQEQARQEQEEKDNIPLSTYFDEIYYPAISQEKKTKTAITEEQLFRVWIKGEKKKGRKKKNPLGDKAMKDISPLDLERLKKEMAASGRAPRTIEYALTTLGQVFRHAERLGYFHGDIPTTQVKRPKYDNKRVRFLSHDEAHVLLETLKGRSQQMYEMSLLALHCGLRAGEVFSLTWKDVDLEHGLITLLDTKSGKTRTVSMTADVQSFFMIKEQGGKGDLVFPSRDGEKIPKVSKTFSRAVDEVGLNDGIDDRRQRVTFHTLRHTFASWLVMNGISLYDVKKLLGHATLTMTERYAHLAPDRNKKAAQTMEAVFQKNADQGNKIVSIG